MALNISYFFIFEDKPCFSNPAMAFIFFSYIFSILSTFQALFSNGHGQRKTLKHIFSTWLLWGLCTFVLELLFFYCPQPNYYYLRTYYLLLKLSFVTFVSKFVNMWRMIYITYGLQSAEQYYNEYNIPSKMSFCTSFC